jgi:predicted HicB family RNase H-like nuclease
MTTEAKLRANEKYISEKTDEIKVRVPKGQKAKIKAYAEGKGTSLNSYINDLIEKDMR